MKGRQKRVAVIGAGVGGLTALKRLSEYGNSIQCCAFEQTGTIGGTWVYSTRTEYDEFGLPVHSSMYKNLRTNLPKEIMELPDFPHKEPTDRSYLTWAEMMRYYENYVEHFNLKKYIKFYHHIKEIKPITEGRWKVTVTDLVKGKDTTYYFDSVIVGVGNYSTPVYPDIEGTQYFKGTQLHSHCYREPEPYKDKKVLVIGSGPSGLDITLDLSRHSKTVILSHHNDKIKKIKFSENVILKPDVEKLTENTVIFKDGTIEEVDTILYCTGYTYNYSFLNKECGIRVENGMVKPLYKHTINIEHTSMCFLGIPRDLPGFQSIDLQVRLFINVIQGVVKLPSKQEMIQDTQADIDRRLANGDSAKKYHVMSKYAKEFLQSLATVGKSGQLKTVIVDIYQHGLERMMMDFTSFRNGKYKIIDDEHFDSE